MLSIKKPTILDKKQIKDIYDKIKEGTISCPYTITSDILCSDTKVYGDDKLLYVYDTHFEKDGDDIHLTTVKRKISGISHNMDKTPFSETYLRQVKNYARNNEHLLPLTVETSPNEDGEIANITCSYQLNDSGERILTTNIKLIKRNKVKYVLDKKSINRIKARHNSFGTGTKEFTTINPDPVKFDYINERGKTTEIIKKEKPKRDAKTLSEKDFFAKSKVYKPKTKTSFANSGVSSKFSVKKRIKRNSIMIQNMPDDMDEDELRFLFKEFGKIKGININVKKNRRTKENIRNGYVNYVLDIEATKAFDIMNKHRIRSCVLNLKILESNR